MKLTYHEGPDGLLYPDLKLQPQEDRPLGKYGRMRLVYLKEHKRSTYTLLIMQDALWPHLLEIDDTAHAQVEAIVTAMAAQDGTDEQLKARDPMRWVGLMNNYRHCAEEIVLPDLIWC